METCALQIDSELYGRYYDVCEKIGADPQEVAERFFRWCADHPRELQKWLRGAQLKLQMPRIPLTDPRTQMQAVTDFCCAWGAPVQIEIEGTETVLLPFSYYLEHFCAQDGSDDLKSQIKEICPPYLSVTLTDPETQLSALMDFCLALGSPVRVTYEGKAAYLTLQSITSQLLIQSHPL